jgi:hypothetical protein
MTMNPKQLNPIQPLQLKPGADIMEPSSQPAKKATASASGASPEFNPTEDMTMTDFYKWYDKQNTNQTSWVSKDHFEVGLRKAYEAGAASPAGTLRDHFAGEVDGIDAEVDDRYAGRFNADEKPPKDDWLAWAKWFAKADATLRYIRADAMLEARKTTGEGE